MKKTNATKLEKRNKRRARVRAVVVGTATRPRLNVSRSLQHMFVQVIDDAASKTLVSVHSKKEATTGDADGRDGKVKQAYLLGKLIAEKAKQAGITTVVFDRAGYAYQGRVKAVADGARDGGLVF